MKILFLSDIHGMAPTLEKALEHADILQPDRIIVLGDVLYHGPRNGVPDRYNPPQAVELLNARKDIILAVRGNCDAEVDQMLLEFPIMADYAELHTESRRFFFTHGHLWNEKHLPDIPAGTIFAHGHTHIPVLKTLPNGVTIFNPGSISLPKEDFPQSFGFYDGKNLSVRQLDDGSVMDI